MGPKGMTVAIQTDMPVNSSWPQALAPEYQSYLREQVSGRRESSINVPISLCQIMSLGRLTKYT